MKKAMLVALRELQENVRTKAFWLGVLALPVLMVVAIGMSVLFALVKDTRRYAVIDQSGWLLGAVEQRADHADLERVLKVVRDRARKGDDEIAKLPAPLRPLATKLHDATDEDVEAMASAMSSGNPSPAPGVAMLFSGANASEVIAWLATLSPEEARAFGGGLSRGRYVRVDVPQGVADPEGWAREQLGSDGGLFACFVIGADPVAGNDGSKYMTKNATDQELRDWFSRLATEEVKKRRFDKEGVAAEVVERIQEPVVFEARQIGAGGQEKEQSTEERLRQSAPAAFSYILYLSVLITASKLLTNTIEEKSNRLMEVLVSSMSPLELMAGKVLGTASTGLAIIGSWVACATLGIFALPHLVPGGLPFDPGAVVGDPRFIVSFVVYFLGGYLLFAALLVAIGSVVNSLQEAQNLLMPVNIVLMLPMLALIPVTQDPNGALAKVLSFIPFFTPFVMMNRAAGPPALWEYVATSALLIATLLGMFWMAAKVFRVGILMTGKPPKLIELLRWIKAPVTSGRR
jgi:ABC-2 type transport system permease protein